MSDGLQELLGWKYVSGPFYLWVLFAVRIIKGSTLSPFPFRWATVVATVAISSGRKEN